MGGGGGGGGGGGPELSSLHPLHSAFHNCKLFKWLENFHGDNYSDNV